MDNVLGLADKPSDFGSFFHCLQKIWIYVIFLFHISYLSNVNWQAIISLTKIFKIFPDSIQVASAAKILSSNCNCETFHYILNRDLWFNQLYFEISNSKNHTCLTIICQSFNSSGQSKYRRRAENAHDQFGYFKHRKKDKFLNKFLAEKDQLDNSDVIFQQISLQPKFCRKNSTLEFKRRFWKKKNGRRPKFISG